MKVIPTKYGRITYRSKTEAQWAVFFDQIGIPFEYEVNGYELSDGTWYLPDFHLTEAHEWMEVKGAWTEEDRHKVQQFAKECGEPVVIGYYGLKFISPFIDRFDKNGKLLVDSDTYNYEDNLKPDDWPLDLDRNPDERDLLCKCKTCGHLFFMDDTGGWICPYCKKYIGKNGFSLIGTGHHNESQWSRTVGNSPEFEKALNAAIDSRFDHGQNGPPEQTEKPTGPRCLICGSTRGIKKYSLGDPDPIWKDRADVLCDRCQKNWARGARTVIDAVTQNQEDLLVGINRNMTWQEIKKPSWDMVQKNNAVAADVLADVFGAYRMSENGAYNHVIRGFEAAVNKAVGLVSDSLKWPAGTYPQGNFSNLASAVAKKRKEKGYR